MGIRNGPPTFQRAMSEAIAGSGLACQVGCFLDDLATGGGNHAAAAANVGRMLSMLIEYRLLAGADKVNLSLEELPFLGFLLCRGQILQDPNLPVKVEAIKQLLPPTTRSELRGFLGLAG